MSRSLARGRLSAIGRRWVFPSDPLTAWFAALTLAACISSVPRAEAQPFYGVVYRPAGITYDVIQTEHFDIIYQRGLDTLALRVADVAETAYPDVARRAGLRTRFHMPIIVNGYNDASNGFVSPLPFRMEIDAAPIKGKILNPRHADWTAQVVPHELAHAVQADIRGGFGVGEIVRFFSPDWGRAINLGVPRGITEGFAVSYESRDHRLGRLNYSFTMMQARAAATTRPWTLSQVLDPPGHTRPFDRFYVGGGILFDYLSDSLRTDFLINAARFYNRWPFLGFGVAMWQSLKMPPWQLNRRFLDYTSAKLARAAPAEVPQGYVVLTDEDGLACRRPKWVDERTLAAFCSGYNVDRGIYTIDVETGDRSLVSRESVTEDYYLSFDRRSGELVFAEYDPLMLTDDAFYTRLKRIEMNSAHTSEIDGSGRLYGPVLLSDGSMLAIENVGQFSKLVRFEEDGPRQTIFQEDGVRILELDVNERNELVVLLNRGGVQSLAVARLTSGGLDAPTTMLGPIRGSVYDPVWSPDGRHVIFSADPGDVANVYLHDRAVGSTRRLTDADFGSFEPSVSSDGTKIAFVRYVHEQYQLVVQPLDGGPAVEADSLFTTNESPTGAVPGMTLDYGVHMPRPYRAFPAFLRPRSVVPVVRFEESDVSDLDRKLGPGLGIAVGGTDPLRQWAYSLTGFVQEGRPWGSLSLQTGMHALRPFVVLSDRPRSTVRPVGGDLARVAYEERSAEVGVSLPLRLSSGGRQSFIAVGTSGEYRSVRLLDSDGSAITEFDDRLTVNPIVYLGYRLKANPRDIVPNDGITVLTRAEVDVQTEDVVVPSRSWRTDAAFYLPLFIESGTRVAAVLGALWQNRGSDLDVETFLPRGYEEDDVFLGAGTFLKAGLEIYQPVAWIDRGLVLIPVSIQAIYLYGFMEAIGQSIEWTDMRSSIGAGVGVRTLVGHHIGLELRIGVARLLESKEWALTGR